MSQQDQPQAQLLELLSPILARVAELGPGDRASQDAAADLEAALSADFPFDGERVQAIGTEIARGIADGWLCDRGEPNARFSRPAKPSEFTAGLSVDVVSLDGAAVDHTHPKGEVTIGFAAEGETPSFDGRPPGWVVMAAGSRHVPTVTGGRMNLIYFIPDGAVEWHFGG
jgi:hypothetical protein